MRDLPAVRAIPVEAKGSVIWVRTEIEGNAAEMFRAAGVQPPKKKLLKFSAGKAAKKAALRLEPLKNHQGESRFTESAFK